MEISQFVIDNLFSKINKGNETVYYRDCLESDGGWIVMWPDGQHMHTYRHPETLDLV